jgi:hypothetical protein
VDICLSRIQDKSDPVRDPEMFVAALLRACRAHPDQRVMQVIRNVFRDDLIFYVEDKDATRRLNEYADETWED